VTRLKSEELLISNLSQRKIGHQELQDAILFNNKSPQLIQKLASFLWQRSEDIYLEKRNYAIAALATIPPSNFHIDQLLKYTAQLPDEEEISVDEILKILEDSANVVPCIAAIRQLASIDWNKDPRIRETIFRYVNPASGQRWEYRKEAASALQKMPSTDQTSIDFLVSSASRERHLGVKIDMAITFGTLGWSDTRVLSLLMEMVRSREPSLVRRASWAIGKLKGSLEMRRETALTLCQQVQGADLQEQKWVAEALGLLGIADGIVVETILGMMTQFTELSIPAGKALSLLNVEQ